MLPFHLQLHICQYRFIISDLHHFKQKKKHPLTCCIVKIIIWQVGFLPFLISEETGPIAYPPGWGPFYSHPLLRCRRWTCRSAESAWLQPGDRHHLVAMGATEAMAEQLLLLLLFSNALKKRRTFHPDAFPVSVDFALCGFGQGLAWRGELPPPLRSRTIMARSFQPCCPCGLPSVVETSLGPLGAGCSLVCPPQWYGWRSLEGSGSASCGEWLEISRLLIPELCVLLCVSNFSGVFPVAIWSNSKGVPKKYLACWEGIFGHGHHELNCNILRLA